MEHSENQTHKFYSSSFLTITLYVVPFDESNLLFAENKNLNSQINSILRVL